MIPISGIILILNFNYTMNDNYNFKNWIGQVSLIGLMGIGHLFDLISIKDPIVLSKKLTPINRPLFGLINEPNWICTKIDQLKIKKKYKNLL